MIKLTQTENFTPCIVQSPRPRNPHCQKLLS